MKNVLEQFASILFSAHCNIDHQSEEYKQAQKNLVEQEEKLRSFLNEEGKDAYMDLYEAEADIDNLSEINSFLYGYRLGILTMIDVFYSTDKLFD